MINHKRRLHSMKLASRFVRAKKTYVRIHTLKLLEAKP